MGEFTPALIAAQLGELGRELDALVADLNAADAAAVNAREANTLAFARAFLSAEGAYEVRKQKAIMESQAERIAAEVAEQLVRGYRRRVDSINTRIDIGRTISATVRSEVSLANSGAWGK